MATRIVKFPLSRRLSQGDLLSMCARHGLLAVCSSIFGSLTNPHRIGEPACSQSPSSPNLDLMRQVFYCTCCKTADAHGCTQASLNHRYRCQW